MRRKVPRSLLTLCLFASILAGTMPHYARSFPNVDPSRLIKNSNEIHNAAVLGRDDRMTEEEYAIRQGLPVEEVRERYSATGYIQCGNVMATAQAVGSPSTIVTVGHLFFDSPGCKRIHHKLCTFTIEQGRTKIKRSIDLRTATVGACDDILTSDWAVLKLKSPMPQSVRPYEIPDEPIIFDGPYTLTQVASLADNFRNHRLRTKNFTECRVTGTTRNDLWAHKCDSGEGTSGAGVFSKLYGKMVFVGITIGSDGEHGTATQNYSAPLSGAFYQALRKAIED